MSEEYDDDEAVRHFEFARRQGVTTPIHSAVLQSKTRAYRPGFCEKSCAGCAKARGSQAR
jgi:hypothetical protein